MKCAGSKLDGTPCSSPSVGSDGFCFSHSPTQADKRDAARRKGGANRRRPALRHASADPCIDTVPEVLALIRSLMRETLAEEPGASRTRQMGELIGLALQAQRVARDLDAPEQIAEVRELLAEARKMARESYGAPRLLVVTSKSADAGNLGRLSPAIAAPPPGDPASADSTPNRTGSDDAL